MKNLLLIGKYIYQDEMNKPSYHTIGGLNTIKMLSWKGVTHEKLN